MDVTFFMIRLSVSIKCAISLLLRADVYHLYLTPAKTAPPVPGSNKGDVTVAWLMMLVLAI
jgi:hypothetical protein